MKLKCDNKQNQISYPLPQQGKSEGGTTKRIKKKSLYFFFYLSEMKDSFRSGRSSIRLNKSRQSNWYEGRETREQQQTIYSGSQQVRFAWPIVTLVLQNVQRLLLKRLLRKANNASMLELWIIIDAIMYVFTVIIFFFEDES